MKAQDKAISMMKDFLGGKIEANDFSFDFPSFLHFEYNSLKSENPKLCDFLQEDMPDYCAAFDPHPGDDPDLLDAEHLREKVKAVYARAVELKNQ